MTSFAVISDIHGELNALEAVWDRLSSCNLTDRMILNAGDTVAYGEQSSACIDFVRAHPQIVSVGGNYDYNVAAFPGQHAKYEQKWSMERPEKLESLRSASEQISEEQREWLIGLPKLLVLTLEGMSVALCHYSPVGKKIGLGSWTTDNELMLIAEQSQYDIIVVGHTHTPFVRRAGKTLFVNPGSVGRSWEKPTFAVLKIGDELVNAEVMTL